MENLELIKQFKRWFAVQNIVSVCHYKMGVHDVNDIRWKLWHDIKMKCYKLHDKDHELNIQFLELILKNWDRLYKKGKRFVRPDEAAKIVFKKTLKI